MSTDTRVRGTQGTQSTPSRQGTRVTAVSAVTATREVRERARPLLQRAASPVATYYVILATTGLLVVLGLVMVLSASTVTSIQEHKSAYSGFLNQLVFAVVGLVGMAVAARIPVAWYRRLAIPALVGALGMQALVFVPGIGVGVAGNNNWVRFGPVQLQPSEFVKVGLVLVGALVLARKRRSLGSLLHTVVPFVFPVVVVSLGLVLAGHDLGTALVMLGIVAALLYVAGVPARFFVGAGGLAAAGVAALVVTSGNRMGRVTAWLGDTCTSDATTACYQSVHGLYALADGGWWGVGLGASKEKWDWLPEAHNDYIFAIIGEELGLPGTLVVIALFAVLAWACYQLVVRSSDHFVRIASAGVMAWILVQAMVNIGVVIGLLPVIGIPLPLVSAGGSALVTTLFALGMLLSFARHEPDARAMLAARSGVVRRSLAVLPSRIARPLAGRHPRALRRRRG